jgi:hypothetical protein
MLLTINDKEIEIPFDPSIIPLHEFISFQHQYGNAIEQEMLAILKEFENNGNEEHEQELNEEIDFLIDKEALSWFTFWSGYDFFELINDESIASLLVHYRVLRQLLKGDELPTVTFPYSVNWNGELWSVQDYRLVPESEMTFNEFITSKETMRQLSGVENGKWLSLKYLAAIFFRKEGEKFFDSLVYETGERLRLMDELPLSEGLNVAFFLISSTSGLKNISVYLARQAVVTQSRN